jgi:outer membrane protein assembly factor BamB
MAGGRPLAIAVIVLVSISLLIPSIALAQEDTNHPISPWPMVGGNPQHTGMSDYTIGTDKKGVGWTLYMNGDRSRCPVINSNGTVFVQSGSGVYALSPDGEVIWYFKASAAVQASPAIGPDGTLYVVTSTKYAWFSGSNNLYAINTTGWIEWFYAIGGEGCFGSPIVLEDGTIYLGTLEGELIAFNDDGTIRWSYDSEESIQTTPAISENGTVYFTTEDNMLYCLSPDGEYLWSRFFNNTEWSRPSIDSNGTIYITSRSSEQANSRVHAINPNGTEEWNHIIDYRTYGVSIDAEGRIIFSSGDEGDEVKCLDPDGTVNWTAGPFNSDMLSIPTIDSEGNVIVLTRDYYTKGEFIRIKALTSSGDLIWTRDLGYYSARNIVFKEPVIDWDGNIYVVLEDYIIKVEDTSISESLIWMGIEAVVVVAAGGIIYSTWRRRRGDGS